MPSDSTNFDKFQSGQPRRPRVGVLGATFGTGNLGVDALGLSMVQGLVTAIPEVEILYQSWDISRPVTIRIGKNSVECEPLAIRRKGTLRHRDGLLQIRRMAKLRRWLAARSIPQLPTFSNTLKQLLNCDAILDASAGDSFATIYGQEVFWYQTQIKILCLELGIPLILMPQTYGPFHDEQSSEIAAAILSRSAMVCSREAEGLQEVKKLCGDRPPQRLVRVPDMAFLLEPRKTQLPARFLQARDNNAACIALNISGLLYFSKDSFGLRTDYRQLASQLLKWALSVPNSHVLLVPHVITSTDFSGTKKPRHPSSGTTDTAACHKLISELDETASARVDVLSPPEDPAQAKYAMSLCNFFVGARMHAFIGAVSQYVPGALLAYSKKAEGLASLLGIGDSVVDMRSTSIADCINEVNTLYQHRQATQSHLQERVPLAQAELVRFFKEDIAPIVLGGTRPLPTHHFQTERKPLKKEVLS